MSVFRVRFYLVVVFALFTVRPSTEDEEAICGEKLVMLQMANNCAGFESYLRGSWWDVQIKMERSAMVLVSYNTLEDEEWAWKPITDLRLSSRQADGWDCYSLKKGVEVSVLSEHPQGKAYNLYKEAIFDAKVLSVTKSDHAAGNCSCIFQVHFFKIEVETYTDVSMLPRILLTNIPTTEVPISKLRIPQRLVSKVPLYEVLEAHMDEKWIPMGRVCKDASVFTLLLESGLDNHLGGPCDEGDISLRKRTSEESLSASIAELSTKNGDKGSRCNSSIQGPKMKELDPEEKYLKQGQNLPRRRPGRPRKDANKVGITSQGGQNDHLPQIKRKRGRPRKDSCFANRCRNH